MRISRYRGFVIAILTRNEHCPPHLHVGTSDWDARYQFSFWHNGVSLWDVIPAKNAPTARLLEELRQVIKLTSNLRRARKLWWISRQTVCMDQLRWDSRTASVVSPKQEVANTLEIESAIYDVAKYQTVLSLRGQAGPLIIQL